MYQILLTRTNFLSKKALYCKTSARLLYPTKCILQTYKNKTHHFRTNIDSLRSEFKSKLINVYVSFQNIIVYYFYYI